MAKINVRKIYVVTDGKVQGELTLKEARELVNNSKLSFKDIEEGQYSELTLDPMAKMADGIIEYPEKGTIKDPKELKKLYRKLSDSQLDEWIELEGLQYTTTDHPAINRMRKCMAILYYFFPKETKGKKKSKYADYSTEVLVQMASEAKIEYKDTDNQQILRMRVIMALKEAGYIA